MFFNPFNAFNIFNDACKYAYGLNNKENENKGNNEMGKYTNGHNFKPSPKSNSQPKTFINNGVTTSNTPLNNFTNDLNKNQKVVPIKSGTTFPKIVSNNNVVETKDLSITVPKKEYQKVVLDKTSHIGNSHLDNQDYSVIGEFEYSGKEYSYAIVSDGCSSSKNSEIGSMILSTVTQKLLKSGLLTHDLLKTNIPEHSRMVLEQLGMSNFSILDATLIVLLINKTDNNFSVYFFGDGFIKIEYKDQTIIKGLEYSLNSPNYISYNLTPDRLNTFSNTEQELIVKTYNININDEYTSKKEVKKSTDSVVFNYSLEGVKTITIMTDGVESLKNIDTNEPVDAVNVIQSITEFKNFGGAFLTRRFNAFKRNVLKGSTVHQDDLTMATAYINSDSEA